MDPGPHGEGAFTATAPSVITTRPYRFILRHCYEAELHHAVVDELGCRWLENGHLQPVETEELRERLMRLQALYRRHIAVEDQEVFPAAARVLDCVQIKQIGGEMAARRHVQGDCCADSADIELTVPALFTDCCPSSR